MSGAVRYGEPGAAAAGFGRVRQTVLPFTGVPERLRGAIEAEGLWVLHEIDPQAILARDDREIGPARQILFFHPDRMVRLLAADPAALLEAPLKLAVMEMPSGEVTVRWIEPTGAFSRYENPALAQLGRELGLSIDRIVTSALGDDVEM